MGPCLCNPTGVDGPSLDCPRHGRQDDRVYWNLVDLAELREQHKKQGTVMLLPRQADALIAELEALREVAKAARKVWNSSEPGDRTCNAGFIYDDLMRAGR